VPCLVRVGFYEFVVPGSRQFGITNSHKFARAKQEYETRNRLGMQTRLRLLIRPTAESIRQEGRAY
jgi:hypothetical protein